MFYSEKQTKPPISSSENFQLFCRFCPVLSLVRACASRDMAPRCVSRACRSWTHWWSPSAAEWVSASPWRSQRAHITMQRTPGTEIVSLATPHPGNCCGSAGRRWRLPPPPSCGPLSLHSSQRDSASQTNLGYPWPVLSTLETSRRSVSGATCSTSGQTEPSSGEWEPFLGQLEPAELEPISGQQKPTSGQWEPTSCQEAPTSIAPPARRSSLWWGRQGKHVGAVGSRQVWVSEKSNEDTSWISPLFNFQVRWMKISLVLWRDVLWELILCSHVTLLSCWTNRVELFDVTLSLMLLLLKRRHLTSNETVQFCVKIDCVYSQAVAGVCTHSGDDKPWYNDR